MMKKKYEIPWLKEMEIEDVLTSSSEKNDNTDSDEDFDDGWGGEDELFELTGDFSF